MRQPISRRAFILGASAASASAVMVPITPGTFDWFQRWFGPQRWKPTPPGIKWRWVFWTGDHPGLFIAVGDDGEIIESPDGINWTNARRNNDTP